MPSITPFLWFDTQAEEAMNLYVSIFKQSKVLTVNRVQGRVLSAEFELGGLKFMALNGGPIYKFTEAVSFIVDCKTQEEIDYYWTKLTAGGGREVQCGWLTDKYGLSWQIVPTILLEAIHDKDPVKADRVLQAMMPMVKLDIQRLQEACPSRIGSPKPTSCGRSGRRAARISPSPSATRRCCG